MTNISEKHCSGRIHFLLADMFKSTFTKSIYISYAKKRYSIIFALIMATNLLAVNYNRESEPCNNRFHLTNKFAEYLFVRIIH